MRRARIKAKLTPAVIARIDAKLNKLFVDPPTDQDGDDCLAEDGWRGSGDDQVDLAAIIDADEAPVAIEKETEELCQLQELAIVRWAMGQKGKSNEALDQLKQKYPNAAAYYVAVVYAYRGEVDSAFEWLDRAYRQRDAGLPDLKSQIFSEKFVGIRVSTHS